MPEITILISDEDAARLAVLLDPEQGMVKLEDVVAELADHAQQGVYRPGAWERGWLCQAFGDDWLARVVPDDHPDRLSADGRIIFDRPRSELDLAEVPRTPPREGPECFHHCPRGVSFTSLPQVTGE